MIATYNFKRFVTFGLGLGIFMSASTGFAQAVSGTSLNINGTTTITGTTNIGGLANTTNIQGTTNIGGASFTTNITTGGGGSINLTGDTNIGGFNTNGSAANVKITGNSTTVTTPIVKFEGGAGSTFTVDAGTTTTINGNTTLGSSGRNVGITGNAANITTVNTTINGGAGSAVNVGTNTGIGSTTNFNGTNFIGSAGRTTTLQGATTAITSNTTTVTGSTTNLNATVTNIASTGGVNISAGTGGNGTVAITGSQTVSGNSTTTGKVTAGAGMVANGVISNVADGVADSDAVNVSQLTTAVAAETARATAAETALGARIDATNTALTAESAARAADVVRLDSTIASMDNALATEISRAQAAESALSADIATAKSEAIGSGSQQVNSSLGIDVGTVTGANATELAASALKNGADYTDSQISAVQSKFGVTDGRVAATRNASGVWEASTAVGTRTVTRDATTGEVSGSAADYATYQANDALAQSKSYTDGEIARVDGRIDATNTALASEVVTRTSEIARVDGRIDATNAKFGDLAGASAAVHNNGASGSEASIATGTGTVSQQLNGVVTSTAAVINATNARVSVVESKTQNITATAGQTNVAGNLTVSGNVSAVDVAASGNVTVGGNLSVAGTASTNGIDNNGKGITNAGVISGVTAGEVSSTSTQAINGSQLYNTNQAIEREAATRTAEVARIDANIGNLAGSTAVVHNNGVSGAEASITTGTGSVTEQLGNVVSSTASAINNTNASVARVDSRIDATNAALANEVATRTAEIARVDGRIDATNGRVTVIEGKTQNITSSAGQTNIAGNVTVTGAVNATTVNASAVNANTVTAATVDANAVNANTVNANAVNATTISATSGTVANGVTGGKFDAIDAIIGKETVIANGQDVQALASYTDRQVTEERNRAMNVEAGLQRQINEVGAMSMAASAIGTGGFQGDKRTTVGVGLGNYAGTTAVAVGVSHYQESELKTAQGQRRVLIRYSAHVSTTTKGRAGVGVGMTFGF